MQRQPIRTPTHVLTCLALGAGAALLALGEIRASDWYRWRGPDLDGISKETGWLATWPAEGPKALWKANVGIGFSSVSVSQGRAYTMGNKDDQDTIYCFDTETGKELWKHTYACKLEAKYYEGGPGGTPTVDGPRLFTLSKLGHLFCLEAGSGKVVWSKNLVQELGVKLPTWFLASSVLVQGDTLFVNVGKAGTALNKADGKVAWTTGKEPAGYATPVPFTLGGVNGLAVLGEKDLFGVDPQTGAILWSHPWKTQYDVNAADPILNGDHVFISSGYKHGAALLRIAGGTPSLVWENKDMRNRYSSCVVVDGHLYGFDEGGDLKCLELKSGSVKWSETGLSKKDEEGGITAAGGKLIALGSKGELAVAEATPAGFKAVARAQVLGGKCWTAPVLSNGLLYCRNAAGDLVCLDVRGK
jgi:outer membrane protein assembly factor BamB